MFKYEENEAELIVTYKDEIIIKHHKRHPAFYLGTGNEDIESYRGNFKIEDYIEQRIGLRKYEIIDNRIKFYSEEIELIVEFTEVDGRAKINFDATEGYNRFWMRVFAKEDESLFGCGEQASYFNLRGRNYPLWTSEPGVGRDKKSLTTFYADLNDRAGGDYYNTYYPEPTFVSSRKYWLHADTFSYADFNFKRKEFHELFFWSIPSNVVISFKNSFLDLVEDLTAYTGRVPKLPDFLLDGVILGVQGGLDKVKGYLNQAREAGVKVSGLWCQDWAGIKHTSFGKRLYWDWKVDENLYPNLKEEIKELEKENVAFLTYICPFLLENESLFNEANTNGFLALNYKGEAYKEDFGEFLCGIVDLTNPEAFNWYKNKIKTNIIDLGIKGWMADFGEYLPIDCVLHNGIDAKTMHNEWPVLWAKCNYQAVKESGKLGEIFYFMRAGAHGSQHFATSLWCGDQSVNWEIHDGISSVVPSSLSTGIIGNPYTHSDIGGYTSLHGNIRTKELFDRWFEMNVFTAIMRTHEGNRPSENFQFYNDEDTLKLMSRMTSIRNDLKPYIKEIISQGSEFGYPVQRPLFMHYENDENTYYLQYEYLFGQDLYIRPVLKEGRDIQKVYLPKDEWVHIWTGKEYSGDQIIEVNCPVGYPPVFYRKNSKFIDLFESIHKKYRIKGDVYEESI
ncbi:alpha-glucosidase [Candidatus Izemoplasma sp. B36]|uniref:alpha-glucosidase n=1 Tax=Candidatus Izemoplasma sp. B36 TaxID=3242468 RepID=UPI0035572A5B